MDRICGILLLGFCLIAALALLGEGETAAVFSPADTGTELVYILDAGHGGVDGGTSSEQGVREIDINLSNVLQNEQLQARLGRLTVVTRREDVSIHDETAVTIREKKVSDLKNRVKLIEITENCVLISVHQNAFTDTAYSGAQVFYADDEGSRNWGNAAQEILRMTLDPENLRKAKLVPDPVYLFAHISCPALLIECGFLGNIWEAALLHSEDYQKKISVALAAVCLCAGEYN